MWRDYLYFSKGERRALLLLLCLTGIALCLLIFTDAPKDISSDKSIAMQAQDSLPAIMHKKMYVSKNRYGKNRFKSPPSDSYQKRDEYSSSYKTQKENYQSSKYPEGTKVALNTADTTELKKIPGIGSTFAKRIVKFRNLLGGFYTVEQLREVYGMDEERYQSLSGWFTTDINAVKLLHVNILPEDSLRKHPYISYKQAKVLAHLRKQQGQLSGWENLQLLEEFTDADKKRLASYLSFK